MYLFELERIGCLVGLDFGDGLLFFFGATAEETLLQTGIGFLLLGGLDLDSHLFYFLFDFFEFLLLFDFVFDVTSVGFGVVLCGGGVLGLMIVGNGLDIFLEVVERRHFIVRHCKLI